MRKRLIFETLHLDVEGGIGERRTTPLTNAMALDAGVTSHDHEQNTEMQRDTTAHIEVQVEAESNRARVGAQVKKKQKKVAFQSERPDLYDF